MPSPSIIAYPNLVELNRILGDGSIDIVSPFYSRWSLARLNPQRHSKVRFITRLPREFVSPPPFLDNDPRPLREAFARMGGAFSVYALPRVHAKLYVNTSSAWVGSANFTKTAFSGVGELMLRFSPPSEGLIQTFEVFRQDAMRVTASNLDFLVESVEAGLTRLSPELRIGKTSGDESIGEAVSYDNFRVWVERRTTDEAVYIVDRIHNKYRMSGHTYSGFHGVFSFLTKNPRIGRRLLTQHTLPIPEDILNTLAEFVGAYGDKFGGPRGGTWRSKLSVRLGGVHTGGGAGDVMVKRLLLEIPRYMREKALL